MPVYLRYSGYKIFFWSNENGEPIHFHISEGDPSANSTKVWVLEDGTLKLASNSGRIPLPALRKIFAIMQDELEDYKKAWKQYHGEIHYYE